MADETLSFSIIARDQASSAFRETARSASELAGKMDTAARMGRVLDETLRKEVRAGDELSRSFAVSAKAAGILDDEQKMLRDGALEAEYALKKEAEAAKKSGRAAVEAAAENRALADSLRKVSDSSFFKPSGMGIAAALSPALIPLSAGIAAGVGAIGVSFGAATIGAGLFGLAAKSVLSTASTNLAKLQALELTLNKATTAAQKKSAEASIAALKATWAPGYLSLIDQLDTFKKTWTKTSQTIAIPALSAWLPALTKGMPLLATATKPVADVFRLWGQILKDNFANPAIMAHLQGMAAAFGKFSASQLTLVGGAIVNIAKGVFNLGRDLAGSGANFSAAGIWFYNMGAAFLTWSKSAKARADVQGFMHYLHQEGPVVGGILRDLGKILPGIFQGATTTGTLELQAIGGLMSLIANLPKGWQKPLTEAAGAMLLLSKTGVISTGLKLTFPKKDAGKTALAGALGMKLIGGALIVPATVMIIGSIIPKDTSKQAAADFKNQPGIVVKVSDFLHTTGMGAWVDQYFSHPIRAWAETSLPHFFAVAGTKISDFFTHTIPAVLALFRDKARLIWDDVEIDVLQMVFKITGYMAKLPGPLGAPFKAAHKSIGTELAGIQADAKRTADKINADWQGLHGKKVALTFGLNLPPGVSYPSRPIKGHGAAAGWRVPGSGSGDTVPAMLTPGEAVVPRHLVPAVAPFLRANKVPGFATGGVVGDVAGNFPSSGTIGAAASAMQGAVSAIAAIVKGLLHINKSAFTYAGAFAGPGGGAPSANAALARRLYPAWGSGAEWAAWNALVMGESGWSNTIMNAASGAYGIPQALPFTKMPKAAWPASAGGSSNPTAQITWQHGYITGTPGYGDPINTYAKWLSRSPHWYGGGFHGWFDQPTVIGVGEQGRERVDIGGGGTVININVSVPPTVNPAQAGRQIADLLKAHTKAGGTLYPAGVTPR